MIKIHMMEVRNAKHTMSWATTQPGETREARHLCVESPHCTALHSTAPHCTPLHATTRHTNNAEGSLGHLMAWQRNSPPHRSNQANQDRNSIARNLCTHPHTPTHPHTQANSTQRGVSAQSRYKGAAPGNTQQGRMCGAQPPHERTTLASLAIICGCSTTNPVMGTPTNGHTAQYRQSQQSSSTRGMEMLRAILMGQFNTRRTGLNTSRTRTNHLDGVAR